MVRLRIGIAGFTDLERSFVQEWCLERFPTLMLSVVSQKQDAEQMYALLIDHKLHSKWFNDLGSDLFILVLGGLGVPALVSVRTTYMSKLGTANSVMSGIGQWLLAAGFSTPRWDPTPVHKLPPREMEIMELVIKGLPNDEISLQLGIKTSTVKTYLRRTYMRIGATNRTHAVSLMQTSA